MKESVRLGRIAGIDVGVNWSVLVVFALVALGLAAGRFAERYPDLPDATYAAAGVAAAVLFFGSLLAHELAHAVVARRNDLRVEGITLWLLGGVARLGGEARDAGADLRVAAVGPLTSIGLGLAFYGMRWALWLLDFRGLAIGVFEWLAMINLVLAGFNLVPAAPLDGGRILRAILWRRSGDRVRASVAAAEAGRTFGWVLIVVGILDMVAGTGVGGLWLALIGWFISAAAAAEERQAVMSGALGHLRVGDVMSPHPAVVPADISVETFLEEYLFPHRHSTFPLVDELGAPVGLVTLSRVKRVPPADRPYTPLSAVAASVAEIPLVAPADPLTELLPRLAAAPDSRALVVHDGRLVGIVSPTDIVRQLELAQLRSGGRREPPAPMAGDGTNDPARTR